MRTKTASAEERLWLIMVVVFWNCRLMLGKRVLADERVERLYLCLGSLDQLV